MKLLRCAVVLLPLLAIGQFRADEKKGDGFVPMFNGKNLSGWVNVNCAPGTFFVKGGEIITTGKPTGFLRTEKQYENFIAEFEWMHVNKKEIGNSGFFVWADPVPAVGTPYTRGIEVQVLVNLEKEGYYTSHGDLFSIHGATCKPDRPHPHKWARCLPSEKRCKGGGEWNHYKVIAKDGTIKLHVNGKEVSGLSACRPRKGYLALESEGAECHFRNLKIKELPSSNPKPEEVADVAKGFKSLYTGLDLSGWKGTEAAKKHWRPSDWMLRYDGKGGAKDRELTTETAFGDCELFVDFRFPRKADKAGSAFGLVLREDKTGSGALSLQPDGSFRLHVVQNKADGSGIGSVAVGELSGLRPAGQWNRFRATLRDKSLKMTVNAGRAAERTNMLFPAKGTIGLRPEGEMDLGNLFVRELGK
jgi:hypothetical protein